MGRKAKEASVQYCPEAVLQRWKELFLSVETGTFNPL